MVSLSEVNQYSYTLTSCTSLIYTASVTISPPQRNRSSAIIDCPGDTISFNCSIQSNSEAVHLSWRVTLPGLMPTNITYDNSSELNHEHVLHPFQFITTVLTEYGSDEYVKSTLTLEVRSTFLANLTSLECFIGSLANDSVIIILDSSGIPNTFTSHEFNIVLGKG